jgi:hypothetical protein
MNQNIYVLKLAYRRTDQCIDALQGPDVGRDTVCGSTFLHNIVDDARHLLLSTGVDDYGSALLCEQERNSLTDSLTGAGDNGYLSVEAFASWFIHSAASEGEVISAPGIGLK